MSRPRVTYAPAPDSESENALFALSAVYSFVLAASRKKKGSAPGAPDDGTESKEDSADAPIIQD